MPSKFVKVRCWICGEQMEKRKNSVVQALNDTGFYACKSCTMKARNAETAKPIGSKRIRKDTGRVEIKTVNGWVLEHRHVMREYLGRPLEGDEIVHHVDENPMNNDISNLELMLHGAHTAFHHNGTRRPASTGMKISKTKTGISTPKKLTTEEVRRIRSVHIPGVFGYARIAKHYGVTPANIRAIIKNRIWRHV